MKRNLLKGLMEAGEEHKTLYCATHLENRVVTRLRLAQIFPPEGMDPGMLARIPKGEAYRCPDLWRTCDLWDWYDCEIYDQMQDFPGPSADYKDVNDPEGMLIHRLGRIGVHIDRGDNPDWWRYKKWDIARVAPLCHHVKFALEWFWRSTPNSHTRGGKGLVAKAIMRCMETPRLSEHVYTSRVAHILVEHGQTRW